VSIDSFYSKEVAEEVQKYSPLFLAPSQHKYSGIVAFYIYYVSQKNNTNSTISQLWNNVKNKIPFIDDSK